MTADQERAAVVARLAGGVVIGIDRAHGVDTFCEIRLGDDGVFHVLDSYQIERGGE